MNAKGKKIGSIYADIPFLNQTLPIQSPFKTLIIPIPGQEQNCTKRYYLITLPIQTSYGYEFTRTYVPMYSVLNLDRLYSNDVSDDNGVLENFGVGLDYQYALPLDRPQTSQGEAFNSPINMIIPTHMNAVKMHNSENYLLAISWAQTLILYEVTSTGIVYRSHIDDINFPNIISQLPGNPNTSFINGILPWNNSSYNPAALTSELDIVLTPNNGYRVSYPILYPSNATYISPGSLISLLEFSNISNLNTLTKRYDAFVQKSSVPLAIYGIESSENLNYLYLSRNTFTNPSVITDNNNFIRENLAGGTISRTGLDDIIKQQTGLNQAQLRTFAFSEIEKDGFGNLITTNGIDILKCTDPNSGCNIWVLESNLFSGPVAPNRSNGNVLYSFGIYNISTPIYNNIQKPYWRGFDIEELVVDQTTTWSNTSNPFQNRTVIYIKNKLEIAAGVQLNLENITLRFAPEAKLIIKEGTSNKVGGYLNMNNSKLEYDDRCEFAFWQGVQVHGNHDKNQEPYLRPQWQGMLVMENNSEINNAHNGVKLIDPNNWARTGGVIRTYNSKFINNRKAVEFMVYRNANNNSSSFRNTQFVVNDSYIPLQPGALTVRDFNAHVTLYDVKGVTFTACTFENNMTNKLGNSTTNNRGIGSLDAGYNIFGGQTGTTFYPTSFSGFIVGVDGGSTLTGRNLIIESANFTNNANGVIAVNNLQLSVTNTDFNIGTFNFGGVAKNLGIFTEYFNNLKIEQNNLLGNSSLNLERAGIETYSSGQNQNRIYKNAANNLNTAFFAQYTNRAFSEFVGLEYNCNLNSSNLDYDFFAKGTQTKTEPEILKYEGVRAFQGNSPIGTTIRAAAGNTFTQNTPSIWHFKNETLHSVKYNYGSGNQEPLYYDNIVYPYLATEANLCLSNPYGPTNGGLITHGKRLLIEQQYATYETEYLNLLYNLNQLIDNGSTTALLNEMQSSWPDHAWYFRNELLQVSPYLSQDALREAINKEILPPAMILEICLANQEVSTSPEFIYWLETEAPVTLPNYMIVLLQQLVPDISARTILQYQIAGYVSEMALIKNELLRYYLNDSLENTQAVAALIARNASDGELLTLVDYLAEKGLFTEALAQLNLMADMPNQSENFANLLVDYATYLNFRADLAADERNLAQLDSSELSFAIANANGNDPKIAGRYRAFLCFLYEICEFTDLETQGRKAQPKQVKHTKKALVKQEVRVFPNPATDAVSVYLENFSNLEGTIQLRMINAQGKTVLNEQVTAGTNIVNLNVTGKPAGIYMLEVWHASDRLFIEKLVIKN